MDCKAWLKYWALAGYTVASTRIKVCLELRNQTGRISHEVFFRSGTQQHKSSNSLWLQNIQTLKSNVRAKERLITALAHFCRELCKLAQDLGHVAVGLQNELEPFLHPSLHPRLASPGHWKQRSQTCCVVLSGKN